MANYLEDIEHHETVIQDMFAELMEEARNVLPVTNLDYHMELVTGNVYRVDKDTDTLTEAEISKYADQVREADRSELKQFLKNSVFIKRHRSLLPHQCNLVDCVWVRRWKDGKVKSRLCARGCFDRQKNIIEKHSSTASRLSRRIAISQFMLDGILHSDDPINDPVELL